MFSSMWIPLQQCYKFKSFHWLIFQHACNLGGVYSSNGASLQILDAQE
jgi:hypothetical protein